MLTATNNKFKIFDFTDYYDLVGLALLHYTKMQKKKSCLIIDNQLALTITL